MVRINSVVLAGLTAIGACARPADKRQIPGLCMTDDQAQKVATDYGTLIATYSDELANNALSVNFTDYSESVNSLINTCPQGAAAMTLPLLSPTFTSREMFEIGQGQQPQINFQQLNIWTSCNAVVIRWETTNTAPIANPKPVVGLIAMEVVQNTNLTAAIDYPWLIDYVYSEFDAAAWLQNLELAGICGTPPADSPAISQEPTSTATATSAVAASSTSSAGGVADIAASPSSSAAAASSTEATKESTGESASSSASGASSTSTTAMTISIGADGTVTEVPCDS